MMNWMKATQQKLTDFSVGSVARTLVEAPAVEIDELYQQMFIGLKEGIEVSVYNSFDFTKITSLPATGLIRVTITTSATPILISASTTFTPVGGGESYTSNADVTIAPGGTYADVLVTCETPGIIGNIQSGQAFSLSPQPSNFSSATNLAAFFNGVDEETPEERKSRFNAFVSSLNRGTLKALQYGLSLAYLTDSSGNTTERVVSSSIVEPYLTNPAATVSLVNCYIHNGSGTTSSALVARAIEVLHGYYDENNNPVPGWKAAGVKVTVAAATETTVNVTASLVPEDGFNEPTLISTATQVIYSYIISRGIGEPLILSEMIKQVKEIDGVYDIVFSSPSANVASTPQSKLMPGSITIT